MSRLNSFNGKRLLCRPLRRVAVLLLVAAIAGCSAVGRPLPQQSDYHYSAGRFHNIGQEPDASFRKAAWLAEAAKIKLGVYPQAADLPADHLLGKDSVRDGLDRSAQSKLAITWIGHSTTLVRIAGKWVLTDPAMYRSVGFGPFRVNRLVPPRPDLNDLPNIDAIVISHGDHDHLDLRTLRRLAKRNPDATVFVPLRTGAIVRAAGFRDVRELDWFARDRLHDMEVIAVPALHGVRRPPFQVNALLWNGWVLKGHGSTLYFAGDTAYGDVFKETRKTVGAVDVALVPIGAYSPRSVQQSLHTNPEEAAEIARIMGAKIALGVHWGTFPLTGEPPTEQQSRFIAAAGRGLSTRTLRVGETMILR